LSVHCLRFRPSRHPSEHRCLLWNHAVMTYLTRKAKLSDIVDEVLLASGTITSPVAYLDLALPTGYSSFRMELTEFTVYSDPILAAAISLDNGSTFLCNPFNSDTYSRAEFKEDLSSGTGSFINRAFLHQDSLIYLGLIDSPSVRATT